MTDYQREMEELGILNVKGGPKVAHVGVLGNGIKTAKEAFAGNTNIKWFYNKNQRLSGDLSFLNQCRWRVYK